MCVYMYTHTYTYNGVLAIKNEILPFSTIWMELEGIMLGEIRKNKYHMTSLMRSLRYKTDEHKGTEAKII